MSTPPISGKGGSGQLGHGHHDHLFKFKKVEGLEGHKIAQVACGDLYTIVLTSEGTVYSFGENEEGQLGYGITMGMHNIPKKVTGRCFASKKVVFVAANGYHSACITEDGDTFTWGTGEHGQLGHGDEINYSTPKLVEGLAGKKAKQVACGWNHTIVRTEDGRVYSFGNGEYGQLGHCNFDNKFTPTLVEVPLERKHVVQVACGWNYSMVLTSEGLLYSWGSGEDGRLGHGSEHDYCIPSLVESLMFYKVVNISSKCSHSVALLESKRSYTKKMKWTINGETCSEVVRVSTFESCSDSK
jgi:RCC1 and BTB domain-containing protein